METISAYETESLLPRVINMLIQAHGSKNKISGSQIVTQLREVHKITVDEPKVRKIIRYIRTSDRIRCLVATSTGYYIAETKEDVEEYMQSLRCRMEDMGETLQSIERQYRVVFPKVETQTAKLF